MENILLDFDPAGLVYTGLDVDDDLAFVAALALNGTNTSLGSVFNLAGVAVCGGNAPLKHTWQNAIDLLGHCGISTSNFSLSDVFASPAKGTSWRNMHVGWKSLRILNVISPDEASSTDAAIAIISAVRSMPPRTLTVLSIGPPSNLAQAFRMAPDVAPLLRRVVLMGGALDGKRLDLNFMSDRGAAREIIEAPVPKVMVPIQTCMQAAVRRTDVESFASTCCPGSAACALLRKMRMQLRVMPFIVNKYVLRRFREGDRWIPHESLSSSDAFIPWDLVALLALAKPDMFSDWEYMKVFVDSCETSEPCSGTVRVASTDQSSVRIGDIVQEFQSDEGVVGQRRPISLSHHDHRGLVRVPHHLLDGDAAVREVFSLLCTVRAKGNVPASMSVGFAPLALILCLIAILLGIFFTCVVLRLLRRKSKVL